MADDLAAEMAALQADTNVSRPVALNDDAGESPATNQPATRATPAAADPGGVAAHAPAAGEPAPVPADGQPPLSYEEVEQRWRDQQGATRAERAKRREAEASAQRIAQAETERAALMERNFAKLVEQVKQPAAPQPAGEPTPIDVINALVERVNTYEEVERRRHAEEAQRAQVAQQQQAQAQAISGLAREIQSTEAEFRQFFPDYDHAAQHVLKTRMDMLTVAGVPAHEAQAQVQWEMLQNAHRAFQQDMNPAELVYNMAQKLGYQRPARTIPGAPVQSAANGAAAPAALDPLAQVRAGVAASTSLSSGGSGDPPGELTLESLLKLDGAAFDSASKSFINRMRGR